MKKTFSLLIAVVMLISMFPQIIFAAGENNEAAPHSVTITTDTGTNSVTVKSADGEAFSGTLIHASYSENALKTVKTYELSGDKQITEAGVTEIMTRMLKNGDKLMVWNSLEGMQPYGLCTVTGVSYTVAVPQELRTESIENPIGIDSATPKFSWKIESDTRGYEQSAYQILVASTEDKLDADNGDVWDSAEVESPQQYAVVYDGNELSSNTKYYWKVRTNDGSLWSEWSDTAEFETAYLNQNEWTAQLVGGKNVKMVRKEINISKDIKSARAYVSSTGYFELHINGEKIGDHVLDPVQTNPDMRLLYPAFDITNNLKKGDNAIGAMLGFGGVSDATGIRYTGNDEYSLSTTQDDRYLLMQIYISYEDGSSETIATKANDGWKCTVQSPITKDSLYYGEHYDARQEIDGWDAASFDDSSWSDASALDNSVNGRKRVMSAQLSHIKAVETITPTLANDLGGGSYILDIGKNISGRPRIKMSGEAGRTITMKFAEFKGASDINSNSTNRDWTCEYTFKGDGVEEWAPHFSISGFQYIKITNCPSSVTASNIVDCVTVEFVTNALDTSGTFTSSNDMLNGIHQIYLTSQLANISTGIPIDCPHRERLGWLADAMVIAPALSYNYDAVNMYSKWFTDMTDQHDKDVGDSDYTGVPWRHYVPYPTSWDMESYSFSALWFSGNIEIPYQVYSTYGDTALIEDSYERMTALMDYYENGEYYNGDDNKKLTKISEDYIITATEHWGDWVSPLGGTFIDGQFLGTAYYYRCADDMAKMAAVIGKNEDAEKYTTLAKNIKDAINKKWLVNGEYYAEGTTTPNAIAIDFGFAPDEHKDEIFNYLADNIETRDYHMDSGVIGIYSVLRALSEYGRNDLAYAIMTSEAYPGYGYMLYNGATTPWENWSCITLDRRSSLNHVFLAGPAEAWLNESAAGISPIEPGYDKICIKPAVVGDLGGAAGSLDSIHGKIVSEWERNADTLTMNVTIPANTSSKVYVSTLGADSVTVTEGSNTIWYNGAFTQSDGIISGTREGDYLVFNVESGSYEFHMAVNGGETANPMVSYSVPLNSAGTTIQAESCSQQRGVTVNSGDITGLDPSDYVRYENVDLTDVRDIQMSLFTPQNNSVNKTIYVRLDSPSGEIISTLHIHGINGSYNHIENAPCVRVSGVHDIYLTFSGAEDICKLDWIKLVKDSAKIGKIVDAEAVTVYAAKGDEHLSLPSYVTVYMDNGTIQKRKVEWDNINTSQAGNSVVEGTIYKADRTTAESLKAKLNLYVVEDKAYITGIANITQTSYAGSLSLPVMVKATYSDGSTKDVPVIWELEDDGTYDTEGTCKVSGSVEGTTLKAEAEVTISKMTTPQDVNLEIIGNTAELTWTPENNMSYEIERSTDGTTWTAVDTSKSCYITETSAWYIDMALRTSGTYYYRIRKLTSAGTASEYVEVNAVYNSPDWGSVISTGKSITYSSLKSNDKTVTASAATDGTLLGNYWRSGDHSGKPDATEWVTVDLGESMSIKAVRLFPEKNNLGMPVNFTIEASDNENFTISTVISDTYASVDYTDTAKFKAHCFEASSDTTGRYVRIKATKLGKLYGSTYGLAFSEIQVLGDSGITQLLTDGAIETTETVADGKWKPQQGKWLSGLGTSVVIDTSIVSTKKNSTKSAKITNAGFYQSVSVEQDTNYTLTYDIYITDSFLQSNLTAAIHNGASTVGSTVLINSNSKVDTTKTNQWQTVTTDFTWTNASGAATVNFFYGNGSDSIYIDNVSLAKAADE